MMTFYLRKGRRRSRLEKGCLSFQETVVLILKTVETSKIITQTQNTKATTINKFKVIIKDHLAKDTITTIMVTKMRNNQE